MNCRMLRALLGLLACLGAISVQAAELSGALKALAAVGPKGAGHREAAEAWPVVAAAGAADLPTVLAALDGANPLAANWMLTAVDAIAQRAAKDRQRLPLQALEAFVMDARHEARGRRLAYELLAGADPAARDRIVPQMLNDSSLEMRRDAVERLVEQGSQRQKEGQKDKAVEAFRRAFDAARDLDQIRSLAAQLKKLDQPVDLPRHFGFLTRWHIIGPFDNSELKGYDAVYPPEKEIALDASYPGKHGPVSWREHRSADPYGLVDLNKVLGEEKLVAAYGTAEFLSPRKQEVQFRLTSFSAVKLWLNGRLIDQHKVYHGGSQFDQYVSRAVLEPGRNRILLKACQNDLPQEWARLWQFQLRVCDALGTAILPTDATGPDSDEPAAASAKK